jgi:hypothetical protein
MSAQNFHPYFLVLLPPPHCSLRSRSLAWASFPVAQTPPVNPISELLRKNYTSLAGVVGGALRYLFFNK